MTTDTIAVLEPDDPWSYRFSQIKYSQRHQGSYLLALQRATKFPENSRSYTKGDPVALIDWKAFARNDQLIVRERREEASTNVKVGIDTSATMMWPDENILGEFPQHYPTKWESSIRAGFHLAYQHLLSGDFVSLIFPKKSSMFAIKVDRTSELASLYAEIRENGFDQKWLTTEREHSDTLTSQQTDIGYWFSDAIDRTKIPFDFYEGVKKKIFFHTLHSMEKDNSWLKDPASYYDLQTAVKEFTGKLIKSSTNYQVSLEAWIQSIRDQTSKSGIDYILVTDTTPVDEMHEMILHSFLG